MVSFNEWLSGWVAGHEFESDTTCGDTALFEYSCDSGLGTQDFGFGFMRGYREKHGPCTEDCDGAKLEWSYWLDVADTISEEDFYKANLYCKGAHIPTPWDRQPCSNGM